jgi:hypothetical protein
MTAPIDALKIRATTPGSSPTLRRNNSQSPMRAPTMPHRHVADDPETGSVHRGTEPADSDTDRYDHDEAISRADSH